MPRTRATLSGATTRRRATLTGARRRSTGPTPAVRALVVERAGGACELCREPLGDVWSLHHRLPRRMGGTRRGWINSPSNLLAVCGTGTTGCHGYIEIHRVEALGCGWLLPDGQHPDQVSVLLPRPTLRGHVARERWLHPDGTYTTKPVDGAL